jgi:hypothetical protein
MAASVGKLVDAARKNNVPQLRHLVEAGIDKDAFNNEVRILFLSLTPKLIVNI